MSDVEINIIREETAETYEVITPLIIFAMNLRKTDEVDQARLQAIVDYLCLLRDADLATIEKLRAVL